MATFYGDRLIIERGVSPLPFPISTLENLLGEMDMERIRLPKLCECGCGEVVKPGNRFVYHHHCRTVKHWERQQEAKLCECGCGEYAKSGNRFITGHNGRVPSDEAIAKMSAANAGKTVSDKTKAKISKARIGMKFTEEHCRNISKSHMGISVNKGRTHTEESRKNMSEAHIGKKPSNETRQKLSEACRGMNNPNWKGGKGEYCDAWYDLEYKDDLRGTACRRCGITTMMSFKLFGERIIPHHIDGNKMNCHPDNFKALCKSCHAKLHGRLNCNFGRGN